jgi:DNA-binding transcriptional ArsR family regulator
MRQPFHPARDELAIVAVLHALSDPTRLEIVRVLAAEGECNCNRFYDLGLSEATISHHLRVLREAGVTRTRVEGKHRHISIRRNDLETRFPGVIDPIVTAAPVARS